MTDYMYNEIKTYHDLVKPVNHLRSNPELR